MNREQLAHVLRASTQIAGDPDILVIGSQAILGSFDEDELPAPATASREADIAFLNDPGGQKADLVDAAIGELSPFDEQFGYYAQGVEVSTAVLPTGWADRLTTWQSRSSGSARAAFLEPHDLALAKLAAFRDKDRAFVAALLDARLLSADTLVDRVAELPVSPQTRERITGFLHHWTDASPADTPPKKPPPDLPSLRPSYRDGPDFCCDSIPLHRHRCRSTAPDSG